MINLKQFKKLSRDCEALLRKNLTHPECLAFSCLHLLGPHPVQVAQYSLQPRSAKIKIQIFRLLKIVQQIASLIWKRDIEKLWEKKKNNKINYLFISHEVGAKKNKNDFYFGRLPRCLARQDKKVLILKINHLPYFQRLNKIMPIKKKDGTISILLPGWSTWSLEKKINLLFTNIWNALILILC